MRRAALTLVLALAARTASAQPALTPPTPPPAPAPDTRRASTALALSIGITTAGYLTVLQTDSSKLQVLGIAAAFLGPSTGQWYAGRSGGLGLGMRGVGLTLGLYGVYELNEGRYEDCLGWTQEYCDEVHRHEQQAHRRGLILFWTGATLWAASTIYDVVEAKRSVDSWNAHHRLSVAPTLSGDRTAGFVLTGQF